MKNPKEGESVIYIPAHAHGNLKHEDCEYGEISSFNDKFIFVKYIRNGILQKTAQATRYEDLYRN